MYIASLDLGQKADFSALSIIEQSEPPPPLPVPKARPDSVVVYERIGQARPFYPTFYVDWLERWRGLDYIAVAEQVKARLDDPRLAGCPFVIDATGVGVAMLDLFRRMGMHPIGITITGASTVTYQGNQCYTVPKRDLATVCAVLLEEHRYRVNAALDLAPVLGRETLNFKPKIDPKSLHDSYAVWREGLHDDLILSVSMGLWYAERAQRRVSSVANPWSNIA